MDHKYRKNNELPYKCDAQLIADQKQCKRLLFEFNHTPYDEFDQLKRLAQKLLKTDHDITITPPFFCDYGENIHVGKHFYANYNCTILDVAQVTIGDNCMFAPNVAIYTAGHPIHPRSRNSGYEYGIAVKIGNNVWIGGNSVVCPGVTIGDNVVIGAGSVVTKDIPSNHVAVGNPCRVIREINEEDQHYYYKERLFDESAWQEVINSNQK